MNKGIKSAAKGLPQRLRTSSLILLLTAAPLHGQAEGLSVANEILGTVISVHGDARLFPSHGAPSFELIRGTRLYANNRIKTKSDTKVRLLLGQQSIVDIGSNTSITMRETSTEAPEQEAQTLNLTMGRIWAKVIKAFSPTPNFRVITEHAVVGIRGTEFFVNHDKTSTTEVTVVDGLVELSGKNFPVTRKLGPGFQGALGAMGNIKVNTTPQNVVTSLRHTVPPTPQLSEGATERLKEMVVNTPLFAPPRPHSNLQQEQKKLIPPLQLEPGAGKARVRITTEIVE